MLKGQCINPLIVSSLALCGHGSRILIADGNYPLAQKSGAAEKVYLGISPGLPTVTDVLKSIHSLIGIEKAVVMLPEDGSTPPIFEEFRKELGLELEGVGRYEFYDAASAPDVFLAVSTGEKRIFANILITVGVV